jgi:hypothetical protein
MMPREMTPMYIQDGGFQPPKVEGLLPRFLVLHWMMRKTLTPRIGYSGVILAYESNLLDALMKPVRLDVFEYIVDEIWNIATNPLKSCGFAPYIQYMIEIVTKEKFYSDSRRDRCPLAVPKDPRASRAGSSAAPSCTTHSSGASSTSSINNSFLQMFRGIFVMCRCPNLCLDVMEQRL